VYAGHAALALLAKAKRPRVPIALLVPIAFAPDWIEWIADAFGHHDRAISHSLVSVGIGASLTALIYWLTTRQPADAAVVWLTYVSHWPADFITGLKPTWPGGPTVGLHLYAHPMWDALLECALVVACWLAYRRTLAAPTRRRAILLLIPLGLIAMQIAFEAVQYGRVEGRLAPSALDGLRLIGGRNAISSAARTAPSMFSVLAMPAKRVEELMPSNLNALVARTASSNPPRPSPSLPSPHSFCTVRLRTQPRANHGER
jgi:hypothetical protein